MLERRWAEGGHNAARLWREAAAADILLAGFAANLSRGQNAVQPALGLPWTTSPVEGQVNRIKTTKRSIYGRAGFQLLRTRVLHAA